MIWGSVDDDDDDDDTPGYPLPPIPTHAGKKDVVRRSILTEMFPKLFLCYL